jgi:UDP-glucose 4-epimerase
LADTTLVTGGAGFIGSHVTDELINRGHRVVVLDDLSGGFADNVNPEAKFVSGSVVDRELIDRLFSEYRFDHVFHLAAYAAEGLSHFIRHFNYTNNVLGSVNLINAAVNFEVKCFVFTSSIAVYGNAPPPMSESQTPMPVDPYGIAKYAVELDLAAAWEMFGLNSIIFRPHNVYGIRQNTGDRYRNVIGIFMNQALSGQPLPVFGDGEQTRAFTDIADVAPAIARSIEIPAAYGQVFNIGADTPCSVKTLAEKVQSALGTKTGLLHLDAREEVVHAFADHSKARKILGYEPRMDLDEGLKLMADWVRANGPRHSQEFGQIEITKNLPSAWRQSDGGSSPAR